MDCTDYPMYFGINISSSLNKFNQKWNSLFFFFIIICLLRDKTIYVILFDN